MDSWASKINEGML